MSAAPRDRACAGRVCMVVHEYFPRDFRVRRIARALHQAGWQVDILCLRRAGEPEREVIDGLRVRRLPVSRHRGAPISVYLAEYAAFAMLAAGWLAGRLRRGGYDVIHVHAPPDFLVFCAAPQKAAGARVLLDIHDLTPELYVSRFGERGGRSAQHLAQAAERTACLFADRVITVSEAFRRRLVERGVPAEKISVIQNAPDPGIFKFRRRSLKGGPVFVHHGTLVRRYGPDVLLEAFALALPRLPAGARLDIYGEGDALARLRETVRKGALSDRVRLHGEVPQERVARALASATACVVPNRADRFTELLLPTKLLEALHLGVPTIASDTPVIRKNVGQAVFLVPPGDATALSQALVRLASDARLRQRLSANARRVSRRFDWRVESKKLLDLYRRLTHPRRSQAPGG